MGISTEYAELKCKTNYSFLEGASHPGELASQAEALGLSAIGIADRGGVYGIPKAWDAIKDSKTTKLIVGAELPIIGQGALTVLAQTRSGYGLLCRMLTAAHAQCEKGKAELGWQDFLRLCENKAHKELIVLPEEEKPADYQTLKELFDRNLYLPLTRRLDGHDNRRARWALENNKKFGIDIVATNDVLYHLPERRPLQDILAATRLLTPLEKAGLSIQSNGERYLKSPRQMVALFDDFPEAIRRTVEIAESCQFKVSELRYRYPSEWIPKGESAQTYLEKLVWRGAGWRYEDQVPEDVTKQIKKELELIEQLQFADYFLTIWEIVEFAKQNRILCQGRGSAANSVVCYVLGITAVDPVRMNLLFERFISSERGEPPDIDVDFEHERREEVIQHIYQKYGRDRAAMVSAVITYRSRSALRDVEKALGETGKQHLDKYREEIYSFPRHLSIHSGGFTLSADPIIEVVPVEPARMDGRTIIQWDKYDLDIVGLIKVDILALGMLSAIRKSMDLIGNGLTLATIPSEDPDTYEMIRRADTVGVFQIESRAQMNMLGRLQPRTFYDLVVQVAIVRPGPISGQMVHPYLKRRRGVEKVDYPHPKLKSILGKTLGVPLFQEQVMKMAIELANFTPGEADRLRRAIGAWRSNGTIEEMGRKLQKGLLASGLPKEFVDRVFEQIKGFAEYGFPESHAASFALLAYASSWLKCHHPAEFVSALINSQPMGFYSNHTLLEDAKRHGVKVRPVDPNISQWDCTMEAGDVRLGFRIVRGISKSDFSKIEEARNSRKFSDLWDFIKRARIRKEVLWSLAMGDGFRSFGVNQRQALWDILAHSLLLEGPKATQLSLFEKMNEISSDQSFGEMELYEQVKEDFGVYGLSLKAHPMKLLREKFGTKAPPPAAKIKQMPGGKIIKVAGLVIVRQRPSTAKGVVFATIEDESGFIDLVLKPNVHEKFRDLMSQQAFLLVGGKLQKDGHSSSILVQEMENLYAAFPKVRDKAWC